MSSMEINGYGSELIHPNTIHSTDPVSNMAQTDQFHNPVSNVMKIYSASNS